MSYRRISKISLYFILTLLSVSLVSAGIWDSLGIITVAPDSGVNAGGYFLKIHNVEPLEQIITFTLRAGGINIADGYVTPEEVFEIAEKVRVEFVDFLPTERYGPQARLRVLIWADGKFEQVNLPSVFNTDNVYDLWANVVNTGAKETLFQVILTQDGEYVPRADMWRTAGGLLTPRFLDLDFSKFIRIPPGGVARVQFNDISANRQRSAQIGTTFYKVADLVFYLLTDGQVLDMKFIPQVVSVPSGEQTGYIADILLPKVLVKNINYVAEAVLHNAGPAQGGIESDKFYFEETTDAAYTDTYRFEIPAHSVLRYIFNIQPTKVGYQTLNFEFSLNRKILDTFSYEVYVVDGVSSYIDQLNHPPEVNFGDDFEVEAVIKNLGPSRTVEAKFSAPGILDAPQSHIFTLDPRATVVKTFSLTATGQGKSPLILELLPHQTAQDTMKNYDPYTEGEAIDRKESSIMIITPEIEGLSVEEPPSKEIFKEPVPYLEKIVYLEEPEEEIKKEVKKGLMDPSMAVVIILLVILVLLIGRLIWGPKEGI